MEKTDTAKNYFIVISGNIGVGKTTFTRLISERYGWKAFYERVLDNPYLNDFYANMSRWSFNLQIYFLSHRFQDQRRTLDQNIHCVQDRSIYEDAEIFAYILHKQGNMSDRDYTNYRELFYIMTDFLRKPDLIVYLKASTWTLISRIRKRGRDYEKSIGKEYLYELNLAYERWIDKIKAEIPVLTVNTDKLDLDKNPEKMVHFFAEMESALAQTNGPIQSRDLNFG